MQRRGDGVAVLTLDRPEKRNALNRELRQALVEGLHGLGADDAVRAVVLTGAGSAFCAGFDLDELMSSGHPGSIFA
jgi:enoyl-CoA hydratase